MQERPKRMRPLGFEIGRKRAPQLPGRCDADHGGVGDGDAAEQRQFAFQRGGRLCVDHQSACHRMLEREKRIAAHDRRAIGRPGDRGAWQVQIDE